MINLNVYEQEIYDSYTKEQVYEAYLSEVKARMTIERDLKRMTTREAAIRYDRDMFENKYFRELVKATIPDSSDENLDIFFSMKHEIVWIGRGYIGIQYIDDKLFVAYLYNAKHFGTSRAIVKHLKGKDIYYVFDEDRDYYSNHSEAYSDVMKLML